MCFGLCGCRLLCNFGLLITVCCFGVLFLVILVGLFDESLLMLVLLYLLFMVF